MTGAWRIPALVALLISSPALDAQGLTGSGIRGLVLGEDGKIVEGARVTVQRPETGFSLEVEAAHGRFMMQGLPPGGPYTVVARRLGYASERREGVILALGQLAYMEFVLHRVAGTLDEVRVVDRGSPSAVLTHGGTGTMIGEGLLHRLPTLDRSLYDFVRLVPQVSTKIGLPNAGFSAGGVGFRFNEFLIDGVSERSLSGGVSNAFAGARSIPLDAVREYQVLLAPYDVRYGDFAGAVVNAVTRSGTNDMRGTVFASTRSDALARGTGTSAGTPYDQLQAGIALGGPLARDRAHFFAAAELRRLIMPAAGPYAGQPSDAERPVPVADPIIEQLRDLLNGYGLSAGSAGPVENRNPLRNLFGRVDVALPRAKSRAIGWFNYGEGEDLVFSRSSVDTFSLSSYQLRRDTRSRAAALQLHTALARAGGGHNELLVSTRVQHLDTEGAVEQPIVRVSVPSASGGRVTLNAGTHESAQASGGFRSSAYTLRNNLTLPVGATHLLTVGAEAERLHIRRGGVPNAYGTWTFASLDDLERGIADRYDVGVDVGIAGVPLAGTQYAAYLADQWRPHADLSITAGLRADRLVIDGRAPYHSGVDSLFGRRTDQMPRARVEFSPRFGFIWSVAGGGKHRVRGGIGVFTGRYPLAWAHSALSSHGIGGGLLRCGRAAQDAGLPPPFDPDPDAPPHACVGGAPAGATRRGDVNLLAEDLRMMRVARTSLAYDRSLGRGWRLTAETMASRGLSDLAFVNLNLQEPDATDRHGRVMYGTLGSSGVAAPNFRSGFSEVIELRNTSSTRAHQLSTSIEKTFTGNSAAMLSYTWSRARDAQTPLRVNTRGTAAWASARVVSGRHDDFTASVSSNDVPHRVVLAGVYAVPRRWRTELSFYYVGESGRPFTYIASGTLRRGDLNADGSNANDPIYVPLDAQDENEIRFEGTPEEIAAQQMALNARIARTRCLRVQRGRILERNSCREPWSSTTIAAVRQSVPFGSRSVEVELDVFNVLNLLNQRWGLRREAVPTLLEHAGQTAGTVTDSQGIFSFDPTVPQWATAASESSFQLQLALRYRF